MRALGAEPSFPWEQFSRDTLKLQEVTNQELRAAGYCPVPQSGLLDGATCGARSHLTVHSRELFDRDMLFTNPPACNPHSDQWVTPTKGCFAPSPLRPGQTIGGGVLTKQEWILLGGGAAAVLAVYLLIKNAAPKRTARA